MNVQEKLITEYPLTIKMECKLNCYLLAQKRYLILWDKIINKENIPKVLEAIDQNIDSKFSDWKSIIVFGYTNDEFEKHDLFYFNNVNTFVVFYLVNEQENKIFMNDSRIFTLGVNFRKYVKKINKILTK